MTPCETRSVASTGATTRCSGPARCAPCGVAPRSPSATGPVTRGRCTARAAHARHGSARHPPRQVTAHHPVRTEGAVPGRPGEPSLRRFQAERAVGVGHHICAYFQRLGVRGLRDGRLLPAGHRLADLHEPVRGPGPGRPGNGRLGAPARGRGPDRPDPPLRPRGAVPGHPLRADPGPVRGGRIRRVEGGLLSASLWPRPSTPCTRPSSSATRAPGRASTMSSSPPPSGSTGTTRCAPTAPSACAPRPSTRPPGSPTPTTRNNHNRPPPEPTNRASTKPGA